MIPKLNMISIRSFGLIQHWKLDHVLTHCLYEPHTRIMSVADIVYPIVNYNISHYDDWIGNFEVEGFKLVIRTEEYSARSVQCFRNEYNSAILFLSFFDTPYDVMWNHPGIIEIKNL